VSTTGSDAPAVWWGTTFWLDEARRFQIHAGPGGGEEFVVEVMPWDDLSAVAADEGLGMGLSSDEAGQLEAFLRAQLAGDEAFQAMRARHGLPRLAA
jgi:hypothetical protein